MQRKPKNKKKKTFEIQIFLCIFAHMYFNDGDDDVLYCFRTITIEFAYKYIFTFFFLFYKTSFKESQTDMATWSLMYTFMHVCVLITSIYNILKVSCLQIQKLLQQQKKK